MTGGLRTRNACITRADEIQQRPNRTPYVVASKAMLASVNNAGDVEALKSELAEMIHERTGLTPNMLALLRMEGLLP